MSSKHLTEDFRSYFEVFMAVEVLEETLGVKSVFSYNLLETAYDVLDSCIFIIGCLTSGVYSLSSYIVQCNVYILLETLLSEYLIDFVNKFLPPNMFSFFWCFKSLG